MPGKHRTHIHGCRNRVHHGQNTSAVELMRQKRCMHYGREIEREVFTFLKKAA